MTKDEIITAIEFTFVTTHEPVEVKTKNLVHSGFFYEFYDDEALRADEKYRFVPAKTGKAFQNLVNAEVSPGASIIENRKNAKALSIVLDVNEIKSISLVVQ